MIGSNPPKDGFQDLKIAGTLTMSGGKCQKGEGNPVDSGIEGEGVDERGGRVEMKSCRRRGSEATAPVLGVTGRGITALGVL